MDENQILEILSIAPDWFLTIAVLWLITTGRLVSGIVYNKTEERHATITDILSEISKNLANQTTELGRISNEVGHLSDSVQSLSNRVEKLEDKHNRGNF